jgi:hypothetical protein
LVDADDVLTPEEEALVRRGEEELRTGEYATLEGCLANPIDNLVSRRFFAVIGIQIITL